MGIFSGIFAGYKEGEFTPVLLDATGIANKGQTYYEQAGEYTRIGRVLTFSLRLRPNSLGTLNLKHGVRVGGLPFPSATSITHQSVFLGEASKLDPPPLGALTGVITTGKDYILLARWQDQTGTVGFPLEHLNRYSQISISGFYTVER